MSRTRARDIGLNRNGNGNLTSFAHTRHAESEVSLPTRKWEELNLQIGSRTPWGEAQSVHHYAPGIASVSCAGHGGVKLSAERNKMIPPYARRKGGWYEEDCEYAIAAYFNLEETRPRPQVGYARDFTLDEWKEMVENSLKNWYPEIYEQATGTTLQPGESKSKDEKHWNDKHASEWKNHSATNLDDGRIKLVLERGQELQSIVMDKEQYNQLKLSPKELGQPGSTFVVPNPEQYEKAPEPPAKPPVPRYYEMPDFSTLEGSKKRLVNRDLSQRWRSSENKVRTLAEVIAEEGITERLVMIENYQRKYYLASGSNCFPVSKATWNIAPGPDPRTEADKVREKLHVLKEPSDPFDFDGKREYRAKREALHQELDKLRARE